MRGNLTQAELRDFFVALHGLAWEAEKTTQSHYEKYFTIEKSTGPLEIYPDFDATGSARIWETGTGRVFNSYTERGMKVGNNRVEFSVKVDRDSLNDGRFGAVNNLAIKMGEGMKVFKNWACFDTFNRGHLPVEALYLPDGKPLFSEQHDVLGTVKTGSAAYQPNYIPGTKTPWYLVVTKQLGMKPGILQQRDPLEYVGFTNPADPSVFNDNAYVLGMTERYGVHGMSWQCIGRSEQDLTPQNVEILYNLMTGTENRFGVAMMREPDILLVPRVLATTARHVLEDEYVFSGGVITAENPKWLKSLLTLDVVPYLSNTKLTA